MILLGVIHGGQLLNEESIKELEQERKRSDGTHERNYSELRSFYLGMRLA